LGEILIDESLSYDLMFSSSKFCSYPEAFSQEHSVEVQLPFLQTVLKNFKIVPIILGQNNFSDCQNLANAISEVIKEKKCLLVASSDMYHGFNYLDGEIKDLYTLSLIRQLKPRELYERIQIQDAELCGWQGVIISILVANRLGYEKAKVLDYTNSAKVTGTKRIGEYCVGYGSVVIYKGNSPDNKSARQRGNGSTNSPSFDEPSRATLRLVSLAQGHPERSRGTQSKDKLLWAVSEANNGGAMLNEKQRKRLLEIARKSIESYLVTGKKLELTENDPVLSEQCGAFVTLRLHNELRGCIGNIIGNQPLYLTVRDMAVEAAVNDPRFMPVTEKELKSVIIEISVLSPLEKIDNPDKIELGVHGVLIKRGYRSGVFLPQVATETGWSKNEFLSNLCAHKAGLSPLAWKDPSTEIYIFTAEVFSE